MSGAGVGVEGDAWCFQERGWAEQSEAGCRDEECGDGVGDGLFGCRVGGCGAVSYGVEGCLG